MSPKTIGKAFAGIGIATGGVFLLFGLWDFAISRAYKLIVAAAATLAFSALAMRQGKRAGALTKP